MELTNEQIEKFQELYKQQFGEEISYEEAADRGLKLVRLVRLVYKPITKEQYKRFHKPLNN
jgi:hypothetical protein